MEDFNLILLALWYLDNTLLSLKPWSPLFNPKEEYVGSMLVWVKLPNLPMEFLSKPTIKVVGNLFGKTILVDDSFLTSPSRSMAKVLVMVDVSKGFFESLDLVWIGRRHVQVLDYLNIPLKCAWYHEYGHVIHDCMKSMVMSSVVVGDVAQNPSG
jgi:hypothetical protein